MSSFSRRADAGATTQLTTASQEDKVSPRPSGVAAWSESVPARLIRKRQVDNKPVARLSLSLVANERVRRLMGDPCPRRYLHDIGYSFERWGVSGFARSRPD